MQTLYRVLSAGARVGRRQPDQGTTGTVGLQVVKAQGQVMAVDG
jgi:hypothetical protein